MKETKQQGEWRKASILGAVGLSISLAFNNPAGHNALHEMMLRAYFMPAWTSAMAGWGGWIPFSEFRQNAPLYQMIYHDNDADKMLADVKLLNSTSPFCISFDNEDDQEVPPSIPAMACHATGLNDRKKDVEKKPMVS
jgi:hypothetical protein